MGEGTRTAYEALGLEHALTQTLLADYEAMTKALEDVGDEDGDVR